MDIMTARDQRRAVRLLHEANRAIADELQAAGPEDVADHPSLQGHARVHDRIARFLSRVESEDAPSATLTLPKFRALRRIKTHQIGASDAERGNARRTYSALARDQWIEWDRAAGRFLVLTPRGEAAYEAGVARGWLARCNVHVERLRRQGRP